MSPPLDRATLVAMLAQANAARRAGTADAQLESEFEQRFAASQQLAVYGTLAPGEANHREVAAVGGEWRAATVRGHRSVHDYPVFTWDEAAAPVAVLLLVAERLPSHWRALDAFEGPSYCRVLVPVDGGDGRTTVANLYEAVAPVVGQSD